MANGPAGPSQPHFNAASGEIKRPASLSRALAGPRRLLHLQLPAGRSSAAIARPGGLRSPSSPRRDTPRILLVDDDDGVLQSTRELLQEEGYEVLVAEDGARALARAERDAPDLVILDIVMPHHSGLSVLQRLRRGCRRRPKIIVLTGHTDPRVFQCARSAGVDALVRKPFAIDQLLAMIQELLGQS